MESEMRLRRDYTDKMPDCVPLNNNNVSDINANAKPPSQTNSKLSKIISCLFLKKKTDVVDMTKDSSAVVKQHTLSVDRSERSRRVLKMESMRTAPNRREESDPKEPVSQGHSQMFLPSENPKASFLSYLNPSVRRACSEVIRTNSAPSNNRSKRDAFTESNGRIRTRNTNYRGQQVCENGIGKNGVNGRKPPKLPERRSKGTKELRKPIVVPGIMTSSDDDIGYTSDNEINNLQDEMRRMNLSQPDLRSKTTTTTAATAECAHLNRKREGSISLSEASDADETDDGECSHNPPASEPQDTESGTNNVVTKKKSMEDVIDHLFQQTQQNIDTIYKNGLECMDLETYRSDTMTPDTYMNRLDEDLLKSQPAEQATPEPKHGSSVSNTESLNTQEHHYQPIDTNNPHLDNLLTEVSIWAQDRQKWLLKKGENVIKDAITRENTIASTTTDGRAIEQVIQSNRDKCNEWVHGKSRPESRRQFSHESKTTGILTGPKLFRSTSKIPTSQHVSFSEKTTSASVKQVQSSTIDDRSKPRWPGKRSYKGVQIMGMGNDRDRELNEIPGLDLLGPYPEPWTSDMYTSTPNDEQQDRSTINDNLSELEDRCQFRARSPDSWLSSTGSCTNLLNKGSSCIADPNDGFDMTPTPTKQMEETVKITASNVGKSHQIIRLTPKVHTPFRGLERQITPIPMELQTKPMLRNTQLKPLTVLRDVKLSNAVETFPSLPSMKNSDVYKGKRNFGDEEATIASRPFSEIPLRSDLRNSDRNSSLLAHSSSVRETRDQPLLVAKTIMRPVSETIPPKRIDKIGFGQIVATKEKQTCPRDVMEKHLVQPQKGAFRESYSRNSVLQTDPPPGQDEIKEKGKGKKRHKVFTNSLIRGGYNYDKHSRIRPSDNQSDTKPIISDDSAKFSTSTSINAKIAASATTSTNDLLFSMRDRNDSKQSPRPNQATAPEHMYMETRNLLDEQPRSNVKRGNTSQSFNIQNKPITDIKRGNTSQSFHNKFSVLQSHGLGVPQTHGIGIPKTLGICGPQTHGLGVPQTHAIGIHANSSNTSQAQTASKFKQIRSRRDNEMSWLMKDAAETEV